MSRERAFIDLLRGFARDPAARGLADDVAVVPMGDQDLVVTHDMIVEGIHYLPGDPPADIAWKLLAVNLSDLAAKGATPIGVMLGYPLAPDAAWDAAFARGLREACDALGAPLLGGDTVSVPAGAARQLGLTAIGRVPAGRAPARGGARAGDILHVTGAVGAAGLGLAVAQGRLADGGDWLAAYRRPVPRLAEGRRLAPHVHAMMDVSDGVLIDASRMAGASGVGVAIDLDALPLAAGLGSDRASRLAAATAGDDYELLFAAPPGAALPPDATTTAIGRFTASAGLRLRDRGETVPPPARLGFEHA